MEALFSGAMKAASRHLVNTRANTVSYRREPDQAWVLRKHC